jgi:glycosyltransferase involved in cell wall biosynthesis
VIWHLIDSSTIGGAERHISILVECLKKRGVDAEAVLYKNYGANRWLDQLAAEKTPFRVLDGSFAGLIKALVRHRPDLLHLHGYKAGILGRIPARLLGIPVVTTFHSGERSHGRLGIYEHADEWSAFLGERVSVSAAVQQRLPYRSTFIKNFVPDAAPPAAATLPRSVAFVGRLSSEKGPDLFCELAAQCHADVSWHVYGDGPLRSGLEKRFGSVVNFHGIVADLTEIWPGIGLLVMPSRFEGLPYAALEALSSGVPLLAARVGGLPSAVVEPATGWLFEPGQLAQAVGKLDAWLALDAAAQAAMRLRCWQHIRETFSESSEMPKLLGVYRKAGLAI